MRARIRTQIRTIVAGLMYVAPARLRRLIATRLLGWDIHPTARIGRSFLLVDHVSMGPGSVIGPSNVVRWLEELTLGEGASIASRNHIEGHPLAALVFPHSPNRRSALVLGDHAMVTVGHEIDCSDRVVLHTHARLAGFGCQVLTHSLNLVRDQQTTSPVELGERCAVMSGSMVLSGNNVPARSIVSAGSVVTTKLTEELTFYRGNPAVAVRTLPATLKYFTH